MAPIYIETGVGKGGEFVIQIVFTTKKEADFLFHLLCEHGQKNRDTILLERETMITCYSNVWPDFIQQTLIPAFIQFFVQIKEPQLLLSIIKEKFYFTDVDEQQQILHIAQSIIEGERDEIPKVKSFEPRDQFLSSAFKSFLHPDLSFNMDSFIIFRLNEYVKRLTEYAEISIEEYKLEQEYQNFIQSLRDYVMENAPKHHTLHILHDHSYFFIFNEEWRKMSYCELKKYIDRDFIYKHPMYIDSQLLAPLVSIAPLKIFLYTDTEDEGMIQTIQNIFQERVTICSKDVFDDQKVSF